MHSLEYAWLVPVFSVSVGLEANARALGRGYLPFAVLIIVAAVLSKVLGSGKTTLLKRLLDWEIDQGLTPVVIMSEFGELDIDSSLIDNGQIEIRRISGGCVCCDMRLALTNTLEDLAQNLPGATSIWRPPGWLTWLACWRPSRRWPRKARSYSVS